MTNMDDDGGAEAVAAKPKPKAGSRGKAEADAAETKVKRRPAETKAEEMATKQREISVAEFFAKNRHLLGFDNPRKALLTTVKEAVDNSLDACEEAGIKPDIYVEIQPVKGEEDRFRVIVEDNGPGIVKEQIGKIFAKLLYGSKFHSLRQSLTADQKVLVERQGRVEWIPIGRLVDDLVPAGEEVAEVSRERIRVPAFDRAEGRYRWREVSHAIRHPRANEILEVRTELGKSVRVTGCHSLFTYDPEQNRVVEVEARALRPGDSVVAPKDVQALERLGRDDGATRDRSPGSPTERSEGWGGSAPALLRGISGSGGGARVRPSAADGSQVVATLEHVAAGLEPCGPASHSVPDRSEWRVADLFDFAASDMCLLKVTEVRAVEDANPFVYDLSVPVCENFVAGAGGIACHNSRGQQGIGISAAGMYGQLTTGKPMFITSRIGKKHPAHRIELRIDTTKNQPEILKEQDIPDWESEHGTRVEIELVAKYLKGRQSVDEYLALTAVSNPHIEIAYKPPDGDVQVFKRAVKEMPALPAEIKPHPHGVELGVLMKILKASEERKLKSALKENFSRVSDKVAEEICSAAKLSPDARPGTIANREADALYKAIQGVKMMAPPTDCLAPIGQELILEGMKKEVDADFFVTITRPPKVYRGNPFCIEVGLALGGNLPAEEPARVMRFANRVPLQYQSGACAITKAAISVDWKNYHLQQSRGALPVGPIVIFVHIASVWVPFTSESKEAIAGYDEIINEMRLGLMDCGRKLGIFLNRRKREAEEAKKRSYIDTYIPQIGVALQDILDLTNEARDKAVAKLKDVLERSRTP